MKDVFPPQTHHYDDRRATILLIHGTEVDRAKTQAILTGKAEREASAHYFIDTEGEITQYLDERIRAWHAGVAYWSGFIDINAMSIGIELECISESGKFNEDTAIYTAAQMKTLADLSKGILARNKIKPSHVLAHQDTSPYRRWDPGIHFDWQWLAEQGIGLWHDVPKNAPDQIVDDIDRIAAFHVNLAAYGYDTRKPPENMDFSEVIRAFQMHFLPWNVCGQVTENSIVALTRLMEKKYEQPR